MINTVLFDMGGTLEDIWYNDQTIQDVTRKLLTFLQEHDMVTGSNEICDYFCGTFYGCFLFRQRRSKSFVSQCNNYFFSFHWKIPLFAVHRF